MEWISLIGVVSVTIAIVWLLDLAARKRGRREKPDIKLRQVYYSAGDWFDDAKSHRPPPPGPGGMPGI